MNKYKDIVVNKHFTMLILGEASNNFALGEIRYETDPDIVDELYGDSDLSKSFRLAKEMGAPYVFVMNARKSEDYFKAISVIKALDFAYVAFASLCISDTFIKAIDGGLPHSYFAYFLGVLGHNSLTTLIATDKHASAYEDVDIFLKDMNAAAEKVKNALSARAAKQNLIFVANNLKDTHYGAIALAAAITTTNINKYPFHSRLGEAIFDIDTWDNPGNYAYFKQHYGEDNSTTIENLLNFLDDGPEKVVFVTRILNYIRRGLDLSHFEGSLYTDYRLLQISRALDSFLTSLKGTVINAYDIEEVQGYKGKEPGTISVLTRFTVWPIGCLESCTVEKGVDLI